VLVGVTGSVAAGGGAAGVGADGSPHASARGDAQQQATCDFTALHDRTRDSVVSIRVLTMGTAGAQGSGFVYDGQGRVVTNEHVVEGAETVEVQFARGEWRTAEVVGTDVYSDLAVLDVNNVPGYVEPLSLFEGQPEPGQSVAALGSPFGLRGSITQGIVSGTNRSMPADGFTIPNTIQTDAAINPGNSGGPLVTCSGAVVGVNRATAGQNVGFAIPASMVERVVPALVENGSYRHAYLGVTSTDVSPLVARANGLDTTQGVLVIDVFAGGPAGDTLRGSRETATVRGAEVPTGGDVIVAIEGTPIRTQEDLASFLAEEGRPGETIDVTVVRDGDRQTIQVTLGERPPPSASPT
jgi:S1-C subfamily serine protease